MEKNHVKKKISVHRKSTQEEISCEGEDRILDALQKVYPSCTAVCGKRGICGKCKIRVLQGDVPPSKEDEAYFSQEEIDTGWRLSCKAYPLGDCEIVMAFEEEEFDVLTDSAEVKENSRERERQPKAQGKGAYGIAIDIGTTTLAAQLLETSLENREVEATAVSLNHQRAFGADVISRIQASNSGKKGELQECIRRDLLDLIIRLVQEKKIQEGELKRICITGNTTMEHLLMGYSCETLGKQPFAPFSLECVTDRAEAILGKGVGEIGLDPELEVCLLPGISAFVGADIAAGLLSCGFDRKEEVNFFLDLGTNGEMAVGNREGIFVTSTAAGPAFEGGNMKWGCGSVPGAICHVTVQKDGSALTETIGGVTPVGICGTGAVETAAELLEKGLMDETGRLETKYAQDGYPLAQTVEGETIAFIQKDIRELQLAKAAVRAGIEILLQKQGIGYDGLNKFYLAGGFGHGIDQEKAAVIGLLPKEVLDRIELVGNSSLTGVKLFMTDESALERIEQIRKVSREVNLAKEKDFQERYMGAMYFEEDTCF